MSDAGILELLAWVSSKPRTYREAIEAWGTHCPRHSLWEDAVGGGLIRVVRNGRESHIALTPQGELALGGQASA